MAGVEGEDLRGGGVRRRADGDRHRRGGALQAGGHVDRVADEEAFTGGGVDVEAHQGLAGVDADAHLDGWPPMPGRASISSTRRRPARTARSGSSSCRIGHAEDGDHGVADELLDGAAVGLDDAASGRVVAAQEGVDELRVVALARGR